MLITAAWSTSWSVCLALQGNLAVLAEESTRLPTLAKGLYLSLCGIFPRHKAWNSLVPFCMPLRRLARHAGRPSRCARQLRIDHLHRANHAPPMAHNGSHRDLSPRLSCVPLARLRNLKRLLSGPSRNTSRPNEAVRRAVWPPISHSPATEGPWMFGTSAE